MRTDISDFLRQTTALDRRKSFALEAYGRAAGNKMVAFAKREHPWKNRSKGARDGIHSTVSWQTPTRLVVEMRSQVHYGIYLEYVVFRHKGRLSIWWPTVQRFSPEVLSGWAKSLQHMRG